MNETDIKNIEKVLSILKAIPKEKHYIMDRPDTFVEIDTEESGLEINSAGYINAWDKNYNKYWFKPEQLCTLEEAKQKVKQGRISCIKSTIKMKQIQLQDIEKEILQLKEELKQCNL